MLSAAAMGQRGLDVTIHIIWATEGNVNNELATRQQTRISEARDVAVGYGVGRLPVLCLLYCVSGSFVQCQSTDG
jgi:LmbE family N-acetylglucosaminyl deacetylase